jgi:hypothetical protein
MGPQVVQSTSETPCAPSRSLAPPARLLVAPVGAPSRPDNTPTHLSLIVGKSWRRRVLPQGRGGQRVSSTGPDDRSGVHSKLRPHVDSTGPSDQNITGTLCRRATSGPAQPDRPACSGRTRGGAEADEADMSAPGEAEDRDREDDICAQPRETPTMFAVAGREHRPGTSQNSDCPASPWPLRAGSPRSACAWARTSTESLER